MLAQLRVPSGTRLLLGTSGAAAALLSEAWTLPHWPSGAVRLSLAVCSQLVSVESSAFGG